MKAIVLAGGLGTRLAPLTDQMNKHLLPVGRVPMIYHPLGVLRAFGFREALIVVGNKSAGELVRHLGAAAPSLGFEQFLFAYQVEEDGIVGALKCARAYAQDSSIVVILGDQLFLGQAETLCAAYRLFRYSEADAHVVLSRVLDPRPYGVAKLSATGRILSVIEKPETSVSRLAVTGLYCFPATAWKYLGKLKKSDRGQFEVADLINIYARQKRLQWSVVKDESWLDPGESIDAYLKSHQLVSSA